MKRLTVGTLLWKKSTSCKRRIEEQDRCTGVVENVGQLMGRQPEVQREQNGSGFQHAVVGLQEPVAIQTEKRNPLARLNTALAQRARETAHTNRKLRISEALISTNDSSMIRILPFGVPWKSYGRKWNVHDVFHK
jgi:ribosomal protein L29